MDRNDLCRAFLHELWCHQLFGDLHAKSNVQRCKGHQIARLRSHIGNGQALSQYTLISEVFLLMHQINCLRIINHLPFGKQKRFQYLGNTLQTLAKPTLEGASQSRWKVSDKL